VRYAIGLLVVGAVLGSAIKAEAINITPEQAGCTSDVDSSFNAAAIYAVLDGCYGVSATSLDLIYHRDVNGGDTGLFADSYNAAFSPSRAAGNITYAAPAPSFFCVECFLVVMDGTQSPAQYLFEITGWNGTGSMTFRNFWPGPGSIASVAIWGSSIESLVPDTDEKRSSVPEPASFMLIGLGAVGAIRAVRRRLASAPALEG
jgi:hypothetical protein